MNKWIATRVARRLRSVLPSDRADAMLAELFEDHAERVRETGSVRACLWLLAESRSLSAAYRQREDQAGLRMSSWWNSVA